MRIINPTADEMALHLDISLEGAVQGRRNPEAIRTVIDRMNRSREETRKRVGTLDVAVDLIRDARNQ